MKKISKKTREQAAMICAIAASNPSLKHGTASAAWWLGLSDKDEPGPRTTEVDRLVAAAFEEAYSHPCTKREISTDGGAYFVQDWVAQIAEAESLLRTGWVPE